MMRYASQKKQEWRNIRRDKSKERIESRLVMKIRYLQHIFTTSMLWKNHEFRYVRNQDKKYEFLWCSFPFSTNSLSM